MLLLKAEDESERPLLRTRLADLRYSVNGRYLNPDSKPSMSGARSMRLYGHRDLWQKFYRVIPYELKWLAEPLA